MEAAHRGESVAFEEEVDYAKVGRRVTQGFYVPEAGAPVITNVIGIPAQAPDPETGKQFLDFILSEDIQVMLQDEYFSPSMRKGIPPIKLDTGAPPLEEVAARLLSQGLIVPRGGIVHRHRLLRGHVPSLGPPTDALRRGRTGLDHLEDRRPAVAPLRRSGNIPGRGFARGPARRRRGR